jgi:para-nitrobenzyl esterase
VAIRAVLIFGQSGGGAKVSHLLAMPDAQGLYHSAGVMSGSRLVAMSREAAAEPADKLLKKLGLTPKDIRKTAVAAVLDAAGRRKRRWKRTSVPAVKRRVHSPGHRQSDPAQSVRSRCAADIGKDPARRQHGAG